MPTFSDSKLSICCAMYNLLFMSFDLGPLFFKYLLEYFISLINHPFTTTLIGWSPMGGTVPK